MRNALMLDRTQERLLCDDENVNTFLNVSTLKTEYAVSRALPCGWQ
jgi:hypothetical protein